MTDAATPSPAPKAATPAVVHQLLAVQDAERDRIYAGLHDDTVQVLAAMALRLSTLRRRDLPPDVLDEVVELGHELGETGQRLRDLIVDMRPQDLSELGLATALRQLADRLLPVGTASTVEVPDDTDPVPVLVARAAYEIAVEALRNVAKHAHARSVRVVVEPSDDGWRLEVVDDGIGCVTTDDTTSRSGTSFGQRSMRQRALSAGGTLAVLPTPGGGTTVRAELPNTRWLLDQGETSGADDRHDVRAALDSILAHVSDSFLALDAQWRFVYVNDRAAEFFGRPAADLLGTTIWTEFPEAVGYPFHRAYHRAMAEQRSIQIEDYYPPWDRWYENRIIPSPQGLTIFFQDVTDRHRAQTTVADTDLGVHVADVWFSHLAANGDALQSVDDAAGAAVGAGLMRGVLVDVGGRRIERGEVSGRLDTCDVAIAGHELGTLAVSWPKDHDDWTGYLTAKVAQMISVRLASGVTSAPDATR